MYCFSEPHPYGALEPEEASKNKLLLISRAEVEIWQISQNCYKTLTDIIRYSTQRQLKEVVSLPLTLVT